MDYQVVSVIFSLKHDIVLYHDLDFFFQRLWSHNRCLLNLAFETNVQKLKVPLEMLIYLFLEST